MRNLKIPEESEAIWGIGRVFEVSAAFNGYCRVRGGKMVGTGWAQAGRLHNGSVPDGDKEAGQ